MKPIYFRLPGTCSYLDIHVSNDVIFLGTHCMMTILGKRKDKYLEIKPVNIFSDGPSTQFKQRYEFSNLYLWEQNFEIQGKWNFFATSHEKGIIDGLGRTVKRSVWRHVRNGKATAADPFAFYQVALDRNPNIALHYVPKTDICENEQFLQAHWSRVITVPNTHKVQLVRPVGASHVLIGDTSDALVYTKVKIRDTEDDDTEEDTGMEGSRPDGLQLSVGDWVQVSYDGSMFPGEITKFASDDEIKVNVMHRSGKNWKWPQPVDHIYYFCKDIVKKINPPTVVGARGQFAFESFA